jgi:hypothetical protein
MPAIMLGSILFIGGIILLLEPRKKNDAETFGRNQEGARGSRSRRTMASDRGEVGEGTVRERRPKPISNDAEQEIGEN